MDNEQLTGALTDDERQLISSIDRQLRAALEVEPSPGFEARLASRFRGSEVPAFRGSGLLWLRGSAWWVGAAAAAGMMFAAGVGLMNRIEEPAVPAVAVSPVPPAPPARLVTPAPMRPVVPVASDTVVVRTPAAPRRRAPRTEAQVQVAPGQEEALRRFLALVNQGQIDLGLVLTEHSAPLQSVPLIESTIVPVTIEPLFPAPAGEKAEEPVVKEE